MPEKVEVLGLQAPQRLLEQHHRTGLSAVVVFRGREDFLPAGERRLE
ncbi:MAG: hypothetical protein ACP5U2_16110 [Bryobacteraceae bacterium]